jgi:hypothetical protein
MGKLVVTMQDQDHFAQEWSLIGNGKVTHTEVFHSLRKK